MIYLCIFFTSSSILWLYEHVRNVSKVTKKFMILIALLIPCLFAAFRNQSIGTDLTEYGVSVFRTSINATYFSNLQFLYDWYGIETGYRLLNFAISRITDKIWILLFIIQFLELSCVISFFVYLKENIDKNFSIAFSMLCYYLLFYNETLNLIRQSIAIAIIIFGCKYLFEDNKIKLILCVVIAMQFHMTAILGATIYVLYYFVARNNKTNLVKLVYVISIICIFLIPWLLQKFLVLDYFNGKYSSRYAFDVVSSFTMTQLIIRIPFIIILLCQSQKNDKKKFIYLFYSLMLFMDLAFAELRSINVTLYRLSLYFSWLKPWIYYDIASYYNRNKKVIMYGILLFLVVLWIYQIVYKGNGETYPYIFTKQI